MVSKKVIVLSLGGSIIIPEKINFKFLEEFKKTLRKFYATHKFIIVCGGGAIARTYIDALAKEHRSKRALSDAGIRATRMNAMFMMQFFGKEANDTLPKDIKHVVSNLEKNNVVFCGALRFEDNATSDSNAAKIASHLKTEFINLTNVKGLYSKDPKAYKDAKFISEISWKDFEKIALSLDYKAGQHFVLDQSAATSIKKGKIKTFILGSDLKNFEKFLRGKSFVGTTICE